MRFGMNQSQKIEFWKNFAIHAPIEIKDAIDLELQKSNLIIKYGHPDEHQVKKMPCYFVKIASLLVNLTYDLSVTPVKLWSQNFFFFNSKVFSFLGFGWLYSQKFRDVANF